MKKSARPLTPSPRPEMGDYSTNAAMMLPKPLGRPPREIAAELAVAIEAELGRLSRRPRLPAPVSSTSSSVTPGTARLPPLHGLDRSGRSAAGRNPGTDHRRVRLRQSDRPLTAASGGTLPFGDSLSRLLRATGSRICNRYYVNDGGTVGPELRRLDRRPHEREEPRGRLQGAPTVNELAERARPKVTTQPISKPGPDRSGGWSRASAVRWRTSGSGWTISSPSARSMKTTWLTRHRADARSGPCLRRGRRGLAEDHRLWRRQDRVLVRSTGEVTYFGADVAYHVDKIERGNDRLIDVLGADHHGYVARMAAAMEALEGGKAEFEADHAVDPPDRGRPADQDEQAGRGHRHPGRADRGHRRRRRPLVPAQREAQPDH